MMNQRSAASLLASGAATINLYQRLKMPKFRSTEDALNADRDAIAKDARRVIRRIEREKA